MSGTKRTKCSAAHADAGDGVAVLDPSSETVVPVASGDLDDDILAEIVGPARPTRGAALEAAADESDFDGPHEDIPGGLTEARDELVPPGTPEVISAEGISPAGSTPAEGARPGSGKPVLASRLRTLAGGVRPRLAGTREISRKAYAGGLCMILVLTFISVGQAAIILARPAPAAGPAHRASGPAALPINYAAVDLERFMEKTRSLPEGGRQILRNPAVKQAIVELDSGEQLYRQIHSLAARSDAADRAAIRNNRVRITSCDAADCGDKAFQLTYDIQHRRAVTCVTEKYPGGASVSYRYGPDGFEEVPHCGG